MFGLKIKEFVSEYILHTINYLVCIKLCKIFSSIIIYKNFYSLKLLFNLNLLLEIKNQN